MFFNIEFFEKGISNYINNIKSPDNINIYSEIIDFSLFNSTKISIENYSNYCDEYDMNFLNLSDVTILKN